MAAAIIVSSVLVHLDHEYGPIESGAFGGPYHGHGIAVHKSGFGFNLAPAAARAQLIATIDNRGSHSVVLTSVDSTAIVTQVQWSVYSMRGTDNAEGRNTPWHDFPALVPPHSTIRILITIHHPAYCSALPARQLRGNSQAMYDGMLTVHWQSLLHSHTTVIDTGLGEDNIGVC